MRISLKNIIYVCKYHEVDEVYYRTLLKMNKENFNKLLDELKEKGLYLKYRNLPEEQFQIIINEEKKNGNKNAYEFIEEQNKIKEQKEDKDVSENSLMDLNNYLFEELKRLNNRDMAQEELNMELKISNQVVNVSQNIINNANLLLNAKKHFDNAKTDNDKIAPLLRLNE